MYAWCYKPLKLLSCHTVAMVTFYFTKMITSSPMVGRYFDTIIAASSIEEWS